MPAPALVDGERGGPPCAEREADAIHAALDAAYPHFRPMARPDPLRIAVIGAGPIGLEAALYAKALGLATVVFERGEVGEHLTRWGHVRLFTPFSLNATPLGAAAIRRDHPAHVLPEANDLLTGHDYRDAYLNPLALTASLCENIRTKMQVLHIGRAPLHKSDPANDSRRAAAPFRILSRDERQQERMDEADVILDCSGVYGAHRWLGAGGIPALGELAAANHIAYGVEDVLGQRKSHYVGKSCVVVGGGYSAATTICALAQLAEHNPAAWIIWLNREPRCTPLPRSPSDPLRERERLAARANTLATRGEGHIEYHANTAVESVECHGPDRGFRVVARCGTTELEWEIERVIANVGYLPDLGFCRELHVVEPDGRFGVRQPEPNYFLLGAKSRGRDSNFLLRNGFADVRDVFAQITGKPKLDLYEGKMTALPRLAG
jgi:thioredoxin reductase